MMIQVEITNSFTTCDRCGRQATEFHGHGELLRLRHLPVFDRAVYLHLRPKLYRCQRCDDHLTTTQQDDWCDPRTGCTRAFANALLRTLVNSTLSNVARLYRISYDLLRGTSPCSCAKGG